MSTLGGKWQGSIRHKKGNRSQDPAMVPLKLRVPVSQDAKDIACFMILEVDLTVLSGCSSLGDTLGK